MRILALDVGKKRIGIAVSDPLSITARPHSTLQRNREARERILDIVKDLSVQKIIIGLPLHLDGTESDQAKDVRAFAARLSGAGVPIEFWDERLTSVEADELLAERKMDWRKRKEQIDSFAASILLESYLSQK